MRWNEFIFSNQPSFRLIRHMAFWIAYCTYFYLQSIMPLSINELAHTQTYINALVSVVCFIPVCILSVYATLYWLYPMFYLKKGKSWFLLFSCASVIAAGFLLNFILSSVFLSGPEKPGLIDPFLSRLFLAYINTFWALVLSCIAVGIKFTKNWHLQKQENLTLTKEKNRLELLLQKSKIQPDLLIGTLENIYRQMKADADHSSSMILNFSDLLSYLLYETSGELVSLEKELSILKRFLELQKARGDQLLNTSFKVDLPAKDFLIFPTVILRFIQDVLTTLKNSRELNLDIVICELDKTLSTSIRTSLNLGDVNWVDFTNTINDRLTKIYNFEDYQLQTGQTLSGYYIKLSLHSYIISPDQTIQTISEGNFQ